MTQQGLDDFLLFIYLFIVLMLNLKVRLKKIKRFFF